MEKLGHRRRKQTPLPAQVSSILNPPPDRCFRPSSGLPALSGRSDPKSFWLRRPLRAAASAQLNDRPFQTFHQALSSARKLCLPDGYEPDRGRAKHRQPGLKQKWKIKGLHNSALLLHADAPRTSDCGFTRHRFGWRHFDFHLFASVTNWFAPTDASLSPEG